MKKVAIIVSLKDPAGLGMKAALIEHCGFEKTDEVFEEKNVLEHKATTAKGVSLKLYTVQEDSIYNEHIDAVIEADLFIFATKHESKNKVHSLTCHSPGNWGDALYGGDDNTLNVAPAIVLTECLREQIRQAKALGLDETYEVTTECTHHGPAMDAPVFFIEIGSDMEQWLDTTAAQANALTIMHLVNNFILTQPNREEYKVAIGIGGLHHCHNFKKLMVEQNVAVGHVCPKYNLENLDLDMLKQAIEKTTEKVDMIIVDWKGLGEHKEAVKEMCNHVAEHMHVPWFKIKDLKTQ